MELRNNEIQQIDDAILFNMVMPSIEEYFYYFKFLSISREEDVSIIKEIISSTISKYKENEYIDLVVDKIKEVLSSKFQALVLDFLMVMVLVMRYMICKKWKFQIKNY